MYHRNQTCVKLQYGRNLYVPQKPDMRYLSLSEEPVCSAEIKHALNNNMVGICV